MSINTQSQPPLLNMNKALDFLFEAAVVAKKTQMVALDEALDRVLAADIHASINVPGFDNSAIDGYALALKSEQTNVADSQNFEITDRISAGNSGNPLAYGCAARIFTGAPIPKGANCVVMQEDCKVLEKGKQIEILQMPRLGENIRLKGDDIQMGAVILPAGKHIKPEDIALVASVGVAKLEVFKKIKVGVFFSGNELVEPGSPLPLGKIFNSNRYALVALLKKLNCEVINLGNIKDSLNATTQALKKLQDDCDLIMTTGGVSVGEEDYIKPAVAKLGKLSLWRIKIKPGKPLAFGSVGKSAFMGLPGNPVSAMVTFFLFARPFIKKMQGIIHYKNQFTQVSCNFDWHKPNPRREFVRVQLDYSTLPPSASPYPKQGSGILSSMVWADGLVEIAEDTTFTQGKVLNYYPLT